MRLVTYESQGLVRTGTLWENAVVDIARAYDALYLSENAVRDPAFTDGALTDMLTLLRLGAVALEEVERSADFVRSAGVESAVVPLDEVTLKAPLPRPNSLRDFMVVEEHVLNALKQVPEEWYRIPVYYKGNVDEVYGPEDTIPWPSYTEKLDYELEICAVIGKSGRAISRHDARAHIAGYTLFNDWSARDIQFREMSVGLGPGLGKDFANSLGPCIATADSFDRHNARLIARINGETWSEGTLGKMRFSFEEIIEWVSQEQTLQPGDLLGSGTVGRGCGLEIDRWVEPGAVVELEAEGIGVLRNTVGGR